MRLLRILVCHNRYQHPGGEDFSTAAETELLRAHGHEVVEYTRHNDEINDRGLLGRAKLYFETTWARKAYNDIVALCRRHRPNVAHFHNTMPLISPSGYYACAEEGVPVVQTLHNFRLIYPGAFLMREGQICEECIRGDFRSAMAHRCYHDSRLHTGAWVRMLRRHYRKGTFARKIHAYVAITDIVRRKFIQAGFNEQRIHVKPNPIEDPGNHLHSGEGAVFIGRLSEEKGLRALLSAWTHMNGLPLHIIGDGPLRPELESIAQSLGLSRVRFRGHQPRDYCLEALKRASFLLFPSTWYETFGRTIIEAYACGRPVIASNLGAMAELIAHGRTGLLFEPGNSEDLAAKVRWMTDHPDECSAMGRAARKEYEEKYTPERNYPMLMDIYAEAIQTWRDQTCNGGVRSENT